MRASEVDNVIYYYILLISFCLHFVITKFLNCFFPCFLTVSILIFLFIGILVVSEFWYYRAVETKYDYEVDTDTDRCVPVMADRNIIFPFILST